MTRSTIDFGIDLGTTNSEIALFKDGSTEIIKDSENFEATPSAVWIDARDRKFVGRRAKDRHFSDEENAKIEFKRQMGNEQTIHFKDVGRSLRPEDLSAEVLLHLKGNVRQLLGEDISAAVITVPADFNAAQIEATNRAARLAGLELSPLIQEPVAAATAYGFAEGADGDNTRWLVFDLGGGTFDAALIRRRDGLIRVENHGGDKLVGGKDIDWAIVEGVLVPALVRQVRLEAFQRSNPLWRGAFAKLKMQAEAAKIQLSRADTAYIEFEELFKDARGQSVPFEYELKRGDLEALTEPLIAKSINICKKVLAESRLEAGDIEKLILVGGPTLMPYVRERLAHRRDGLGIPLEFGVDPFTVVARGAAIIARTQPLAHSGPVRAGQYPLRLDYRAIGPDEDPLLSGQVLASQGQSLSGFTIEFINRVAEPAWRSGKLGLSPEGRFMTSLWAQKGKENLFQIELLDARGAVHATVPEQFPYTVGGGTGAQTLIHTIGVGTSDNTVVVFIEKGATLPARKRIDLVTTVNVKRGSASDAIKVPVIEGEERRADRNEIVGTFSIPATHFAHDVPAGSDIEVTIVADESRCYTAKVFIPMLDEEFESVIIGTTQHAPIDDLKSQVASEKQRLAQLREKVDERQQTPAPQLLARVDQERLGHELDLALAAAGSDQDASDKCASRLHDLQVALDAVEEALHWPDQVALAQDRIDFANRVANKHGTVSDKELLKVLVREVNEAVESGDAGLVQTRCTALDAFAYRIWRDTDEYLTGMLSWLEEELPAMRNQSEAQALLAQGNRAINGNDRTALRRAVDGLLELLPPLVAAQGPFADQSTVTRRAG